MKYLITAFLILSTASSYSQDNVKEIVNDKKFGTVKGRILKKLDERIALFNKLRDCMDAASATKELKQCSDKYAAEAKRQSATYKVERKKSTKQ